MTDNHENDNTLWIIVSKKWLRLYFAIFCTWLALGFVSDYYKIRQNFVAESSYDIPN